MTRAPIVYHCAQGRGPLAAATGSFGTVAVILFVLGLLLLSGVKEPVASSPASAPPGVSSVPAPLASGAVAGGHAAHLISVPGPATIAAKSCAGASGCAEPRPDNDPLVTQWYNTTATASVTPSSSPPPMVGTSMVYDPGNPAYSPVAGVEIMFGGETSGGGGGVTNYTYAGVPTTITLPGGASTSSMVWVNISSYEGVSIPAPSPRFYASMTYDTHDGYTLLFGGCPAGCLTSLADTWTLSVTYQGETLNPPAPPHYNFVIVGWTKLVGRGGPSARAAAGMTYDPLDNYTVLYGGYDNPNVLGDTWTYSGGLWTQLSPATSPPPQAYGGLVFDQAAGYAVLVAGLGGSTFEWAFVHGMWFLLLPTTPLGARWYESVAYNTGSGNVTVFGGENVSTSATYSDTWNFSWPPAWTQVDSYGPIARVSAAMAYDPQIGCSVLFGGGTFGGGLLNDTWLLCTWPLTIAPFSVTLSAEPGISDRPEVQVGDNATFTADPSGGTWPYHFAFELFSGAESFVIKSVTADGPSSETFSFSTPGNYLLIVYVHDTNNAIATTNLTYPVGTLLVPNWQPLRDFYSFANYGSGWSPGGNCWGFATTAVLYWEHDIEGTADSPYLPAATYSTFTLHEPPGIKPFPGPGLNSTTLSIMLHQTLDPANSINNSFSGSAMASSYASLVTQLQKGNPVVLTVAATNRSIGYHAIVAYGEWTAPNGTVEILTSDSNSPGNTNIGLWDPTSKTFAFVSEGVPVNGFAVALPAPAVSTLQPSWLGKWAYDGFSQSYDTQGFGFEVVAADVPLSITSSGGGHDFFALPSEADSQTFSGSIAGSSGVEEPFQSGNTTGTVQAYALPLSPGVSYTVSDPSDGSSQLEVIEATNASGTPVVQGYSINVTSAGEHDFTLISGTNGTRMSVANNPVNVTIGFARLVGNVSDVLNASSLPFPAMSQVEFAVLNWTALESTTTPSVSVDVTTDNGTGPTAQYALENGQTGLGPGTTLSYSVTFLETGLPTGTNWSATLNGLTLDATAPTIVFNEMNGSYSYTTASQNSRYEALGGSLTVDGAAVSEPVTFHLVTNSLIFRESGILSNTLARHGWTVGLNGTVEHSTSPTITFGGVPNGTYPVLVTGPSGYGTSEPGNQTISGPTTIPIVFTKSKTATLSFTEKGLPRGQSWCVEVYGAELCTAAKELRFLNLTTGNGVNYAWVVVSPTSGQLITSHLGRATGGAAGSAVGFESSSVVALSFVYDFRVTFTQSGLASGTWSVTIKGVTESAAVGDSIVFNLPNGTYDYKIEAQSGYVSSGSPPKAKVVGGPASVTVAFRAREGREPTRLRGGEVNGPLLPSIRWDTGRGGPRILVHSSKATWSVSAR